MALGVLQGLALLLAHCVDGGEGVGVAVRVGSTEGEAGRVEVPEMLAVGVAETVELGEALRMGLGVGEALGKSEGLLRVEALSAAVAVPPGRVGEGHGVALLLAVAAKMGEGLEAEDAPGEAEAGALCALLRESCAVEEDVEVRVRERVEEGVSVPGRGLLEAEVQAVGVDEWVMAGEVLVQALVLRAGVDERREVSEGGTETEAEWDTRVLGEGGTEAEGEGEAAALSVVETHGEAEGVAAWEGEKEAEEQEVMEVLSVAVGEVVGEADALGKGEGLGHGVVAALGEACKEALFVTAMLEVGREEKVSNCVPRDGTGVAVSEKDAPEEALAARVRNADGEEEGEGLGIREGETSELGVGLPQGVEVKQVLGVVLLQGLVEGVALKERGADTLRVRVAKFETVVGIGVAVPSKAVTLTVRVGERVALELSVAHWEELRVGVAEGEGEAHEVGVRVLHVVEDALKESVPQVEEERLGVAVREGRGVVESVLQGEGQFEGEGEAVLHTEVEREPVLHCDAVEEAVSLGEGVVETVLQGERVGERELELH